MKNRIFDKGFDFKFSNKSLAEIKSLGDSLIKFADERLEELEREKYAITGALIDNLFEQMTKPLIEEQKGQNGKT